MTRFIGADLVQYSQWAALRTYAHERKIAIMGDIPIFVAHDSADVWAHPELFFLAAAFMLPALGQTQPSPPPDKPRIDPKADAALKNKPVAVIGTSTGMFGAVWAQAETRKALAGAGARVIDRELPVGSADEQFHPLDGRLTEKDIETELGGILAELVSEVEPALARAG